MMAARLSPCDLSSDVEEDAVVEETPYYQRAQSNTHDNFEDDLEQYDIAILYSNKDQYPVAAFKQKLQDKIVLKDGKPPKISTYHENGRLGHSIFDNLEKTVKQSTFLLLYLTKNFLDDSWAQMQTHTALSASLTDVNKRWCVIPVHTSSKRRQSYKMPFVLDGIFYIHLKHLDDREAVQNISRNFDEKHHLRLNRENEERHRRSVKEFEIKAREQLIVDQREQELLDILQNKELELRNYQSEEKRGTHENTTSGLLSPSRNGGSPEVQTSSESILPFPVQTTELSDKKDQQIEDVNRANPISPICDISRQNSLRSTGENPSSKNSGLGLSLPGKTLLTSNNERTRETSPLLSQSVSLKLHISDCDTDDKEILASSEPAASSSVPSLTTVPHTSLLDRPSPTRQLETMYRNSDQPVSPQSSEGDIFTTAGKGGTDSPDAIVQQIQASTIVRQPERTNVVTGMQRNLSQCYHGDHTADELSRGLEAADIEEAEEAWLWQNGCL